MPAKSFRIPVDSLREHNIPSIGDSGTFLTYIVQVYDLDDPISFKIKREKDNKYLSRNLKFENLKNKLLKKASVKDFPDINDFPY